MKQRKRINRSVNAQYGVSTKVSIYEAGKRLRINLIVCDTDSEELHAWCGSKVSYLFDRTESVLSAVIIMDERKLVFPACAGELSVAQVQCYESAAMLLADFACIEK